MRTGDSDVALGALNPRKDAAADNVDSRRTCPGLTGDEALEDSSEPGRGVKGEPTGACSFFGLVVGSNPKETGAELPETWKKSANPLESRFGDSEDAVEGVLPGVEAATERVGDEFTELRLGEMTVLAWLRRGLKFKLRLVLGLWPLQSLPGL